jgi:FKBP-type peptidyl-prolyl cis-trans isomerase
MTARMKKLLVVVALLSAAAACKKEEKMPGGPAKPGDQKVGDPAKKPGQPGAPQMADIPAPADVAAPPADAQKTASGIAWKVLTPGTGTEHPAIQDRVKVNYTGWTTDGKMFDSSSKHGQPATFALKQVIPGWTEGLQLMVVGEKRQFWIPKELAYNDRPGKPAGMLVFQVEMLEIIPGPKPIAMPEGMGAPPADAQKDDKTGLSWKVTTKGTGKDKPSEAAYAEFHFTAWSPDGVMIDSTVQRGRPLNIPVDKGIPAWKAMLPQMVAGEKRMVWAPEEMAFKGRPGAKGGLTVFELELVKFVEPPKAPADVKEAPKDAQKTTHKLPDGKEYTLFSKVLSKGKDAKPTADDTVEVHYTGWTTDGKMFDSSVTRGKPARFPLKGVIPGWTDGVQLMQIGEKRRFWIPEEAAYKGQPGAPAGMLVFDVELLSINPAPAAPVPTPATPPAGHK